MEEKIREIIEKVVEDYGYLVDVILKGDVGSYSLKVIVDTDSGITLNEVTAITRILNESEELDNLLQGGYHLEVSSPGIDFKMTEPRHFRKHINRELEVFHRDESLKNPLNGRLISVDHDQLVIESRKEGTVSLPFQLLEYGKVKLKF